MQRRELSIKWKITQTSEVNEPQNIDPYASSPVPIRGPVDVARYLAPWSGETQEVFVLVALDARMRIIGHKEIARGDIASCPVPISVVCRAAVLSGAYAVIVAHNHPSGDCSPSTADIEMTRKLVSACAAIDVPLLDHLVIGLNQFGCHKHYSIRDSGKVF